MDKITSRSINDAHELNAIIGENRRRFSQSFLDQWKAAYERYSNNGDSIGLRQGEQK